jgi:hypothetical protein
MSRIIGRSLHFQTVIAVLAFCVSLHARPQQPEAATTEPHLQILSITVEDPKNPSAPTEFSLGKTIQVKLAPGNLNALRTKATD